jgi:exonuclease SbcC
MANATRRSLISELEEVRGLFGRGGLQRAYLTRLFDILVEETQEALSVWEDDFNVIADPEQPFNFLFSRVNRPDDYMDQELLSGGQRLRLALSFIMGLQRVLYPGLNFMCADEPSNHMDAEGTEGLVRVFRQIGMESDSDSQVILVDHKPELLAAAGKVKVLPKLPAED